MDSLLGDNLIFIISQPRVGSTLLQRMLGTHPDIHTTLEPWLMLHPTYALRSEGYEAEYSALGARIFTEKFLQTLPGGEEDYIEALRRMCCYLYERALVNSDKRYFLDKTPRYYLIIPELYRVFPRAHYIILLRNPLAVLCSILSNWIEEEWFWLHGVRHDLLRAPRLILEGIELLGERSLVVHYERLVEHPEEEIQKLCQGMGVDFVPEMIEYGRQPAIPRWSLGDQKSVYQYTRPVPQYAEEWVRALENPQVWRLASDYLHVLGRETVEQMGYSWVALEETLETRRAGRFSRWFTFSMAWLMKKPPEERRWWERNMLRLTRSLRRQGGWGTVITVLRRVANVISPN